MEVDPQPSYPVAEYNGCGCKKYCIIPFHCITIICIITNLLLLYFSIFLLTKGTDKLANIEKCSFKHRQHLMSTLSLTIIALFRAETNSIEAHEMSSSTEIFSKRRKIYSL